MIKKILGIIRAPFLVLVPACLSPAIAVAWAATDGQLNTDHLWLIIIAGLAAHIAVNALNEYNDFRSGLDFITERTPFSGGSGTLVEHAEFAPAAFYVGLLALLVTASIGLYFSLQYGWTLILPGLLGVGIIVTYTRWINRLPLLCLVAPGVGFGLLMVNLSVLVLTGDYLPQGIAVSIPVALLCCNLLLLNQLPDIEADRRVGRRHIAIVAGMDKAIFLYILIGSMIYIALLTAVIIGILPLLSLLGGLTLPLSVWLWVALRRGAATDGNQLVKMLGLNVSITLATPVLIAVGMALQ